MKYLFLNLFILWCFVGIAQQNKLPQSVEQLLKMEGVLISSTSISDGAIESDASLSQFDTIINNYLIDSASSVDFDIYQVGASFDAIHNLDNLKEIYHTTIRNEIKVETNSNDGSASNAKFTQLNWMIIAHCEGISSNSFSNVFITVIKDNTEAFIIVPRSNFNIDILSSLKLYISSLKTSFASLN